MRKIGIINELEITKKMKNVKIKIKDNTINLNNRYKEEMSFLNKHIDEYVSILNKQNYSTNILKRINLMEDAKGIIYTIIWYLDFLYKSMQLTDNVYIAIGKELEDIIKMNTSYLKYLGNIKNTKFKNSNNGNN